MSDRTADRPEIPKSRHAHWDCFGGASIDCMLAACVDALDPSDDAQELLHDALVGVVADFRLETERVQIYGMEARKARLKITSNIAREQQNSRQLIGIFDGVGPLSVPIRVRETVHQVLSGWEEAESSVRGVPTTSVALDGQSLIAILFTAFLLHHLGVETVSCGPIPLGQGSTYSDDESFLPIPSPTALQLLLGMPTCPGPAHLSNTELVTPSAAALLRALTNSSKTVSNTVTAVAGMPAAFRPQQIGVGTGGPNSTLCLRLIIGRPGDASSTIIGRKDCHQCPESNTLPWHIDTMTILEANLDDMTAESLAFAVELLLLHGAADAWVTQIVMKKGRAAYTLHCLCRSNQTYALLELLFRHTTTLGVRVRTDVARAALKREVVPIYTRFRDSKRDGIIDVKVGYMGDEIVSVKAEFDHCKDISLETGIPIKEISDLAVCEARKHLDKDSSAI